MGIKGAIKFSKISDFHFKCSSIMTSKENCFLYLINFGHSFKVECYDLYVFGMV